MVRFHWHVEEGAGASILPGSMDFAAPADNGVQHVAVDIEIPGEAAAAACITVPAGYLRQGGQIGELGVLLGHDDPAEWRGPLLDALAVMLAEAGHVVVRYHSNGSELRRQRLYEKALDVCATSPFARSVQRWVLAGVGHGARLAAVVGTRVRGTVAGYALLAFPLADKLQTAKGSELPDSSVLLLRLDAPVLFVQGGADKKVAAEQLRKVAAQMKAKTAPRLAVVPGVDNSFLSGKPPALTPATLAGIREPLLSFVAAAAAGTPGECSAPLANPEGTAAAELKGSAAAGIAAQIQMLDDDDAAVYDLEPLGKPSEAAAANGSGGGSQQQKAQQLLLQQAVMQQQQVQLAAAAKVGLTLQQAQQAAAVQRVAAAAAAAQQGKPGAGGAAAGGPSIVLPGGFAQLTPQMLAAAQAMQLAAAKQQSAGKK